MKTLGLDLGLAVAAIAALFAWGQPPPGDPFRSTLLLLPLIVLAVRTLERFGRAAGGRRLDPRGSRIEGVFLALLVVLTLRRQTLGVPAIDAYLAVGFLLLLMSRCARLLVALRPCLGSSLPRRPPLLFFFLPWVAYLAIQPWMSEHRPPDGDEPYNLLLTHSLAYDLDLDLANNYRDEDWRAFMDRAIEPQIGDPRGEDGEVYSRHNALLPLVLSPVYRVSGFRGAMVLIAGWTALLAWMVLRLAATYAPERPGAAWLAYGLFAFSPPVLIYSYQLWVEVPAALALALAFDRLLLSRREGWRRIDLLVFAAAVAALPLLKLRFTLVAVPLVLLAIARTRPSRSFLGWVGGSVVLLSGAVLITNQIRYGNPLKIHQWSELTLRGKSPEAFVHGAVGVFFDSAFGIFACAPIWWLLLPAALVAIRHRDSLGIDLLALGLVYNLALWPRLEWYGGWAPPFRYPFLFLPLLALLLIPLCQRRKTAGFQLAFGFLAVVTVALGALWVVAPGWTYNFADGRGDWLDALSRLLGADVARFFPSAVRPRTATWVWLALSFALAPLVLGWRSRLRGAGSLGAALVILAALGLPIAAKTVPTRVVEIEDPQIRHRRTIAFPETWMMQRSSARAGRQVKHGGTLSFPVVPGGDRLEIRLVAKTVGPAPTLELGARTGDRDLGRAEVERRDWYEVQLGPFSWDGERQVVITGPEGNPDSKGGVMIDKVELSWSEADDP